MEFLRHRGIEDRHDLAGRTGALSQLVENRLLPHQPVVEQRLNERPRVGHGSAVGRVKHLIVGPVEKDPQRLEVGADVAIWGWNDRGRPTHDVVTGEDGSLFGECEAQVVADVAGRVKCLDGVAGPFDDIAVGESGIGIEIDVRGVLGPKLRSRPRSEAPGSRRSRRRLPLIIGVVVVILTLAEGRVGWGPNPSTGAPVASDSAAAAGE